MTDFEKAKKQLMYLLERYKNRLQKVYIDDTFELVYYGEYSIALEKLCDSLTIERVPVSPKEFDLIVKLGIMLKANEKYWSSLGDQKQKPSIEN